MVRISNTETSPILAHFIHKAIDTHNILRYFAHSAHRMEGGVI